MKEFVCIVCPRGCTLSVDKINGEYSVSGNSCKRGEAFAMTEMTAPARTICSTVRTVFPSVPALPVRVSSDIPKEKIFDVMKEIKSVTADKIYCRGDVIIADVLGTGADVICTSDILKCMNGGK